MANPMLFAVLVASPRATAVLMPTTWPAALTSGPPEFPEEIAASVWINPSSAPLSVIIVRSSALMMPSVTLASPSRSSAKPMATTSSPTRTLAGSAKVAGVRPVTSTWRIAKSLVVSVATIFAGRGSRSVSRRTRTSLAPSTTWALVRIWPSDVNTTPVPTPSPLNPDSLMSEETLTTLGRSADVTAATSRRLSKEASRGPPVVTGWLEKRYDAGRLFDSMRAPTYTPSKPTHHAPTKSARTQRKLRRRVGSRKRCCFSTGQGAGVGGGIGTNGSPAPGGGSDDGMKNVYPDEASTAHRLTNLTIPRVASRLRLSASLDPAPPVEGERRA